MPFSAILPTQPGWYWVMNDKNPTPTIVQVVQMGFGASTLLPALVVQNWTPDGTEQWSGPLLPS
jgi:hypothetical protein